jgi:transcriptional regulator with XRE-family HTH domain
MTQADLARMARASLSTIRKIEQGTRQPSDHILRALAGALGTTAERLAGASRTTGVRMQGAVADIRAVIAGYDLPDAGLVKPLAELRTAVAVATRQRVSSQYASLAETAPTLLRDLIRAVHTYPGAERAEAFALLADGARAADAMAYKGGYHDLSARLVDVMRWAADLSENPTLVATAAYVRTETFLASHNLDPGLRALDIAISAAPSSRSQADHAALGALHMRAAVVAARLLHDRDVVDDHLRAAWCYADGMREGVYHGTAFGPESLRVHQVAVAVELGDGHSAARIAGEWVPPRDLPAERRSHYFIDLARAQLWIGQRDQAFRSLRIARQVAPQHVREHPHVREVLLTLLRLRRRPPEALTRFAEWAGAL